MRSDSSAWFRWYAERAGTMRWTGSLMSSVVNAAMAWGGWQMRVLGRRWAAMAAAMLAVVPCLFTDVCTVMAMPVGVWCLLVLLRPEVRAAFHEGRSAASHTT